MKKYLGSLLTLMMVATMSFVFTSCGDDDDDTPDFVGEWQECESTGDYNFKDDETGYEVAHLRLRKDGTGEYWDVTKGKKNEYENTFDYTISFSGMTGTITLVCRSSSDESEVGTTESAKFTYVDGILHIGETFYKKK